jgi:hypothetical protein
MGLLSQIVAVYAILFMFSVVWFNGWLSLALGFLGICIIVTLLIVLGNVNEAKTRKWARDEKKP